MILFGKEKENVLLINLELSSGKEYCKDSKKSDLVQKYIVLFHV
jgi:hypothetical protein